MLGITRESERDLVLHCVLRREEEDRRLESLRAQAAPDFDALEIREHPVENDEIGSIRAAAPSASFPVRASSTSKPS